MCRSIVRLRDGSEIHGSAEIEAAALQYVRKVSGFRHPALHNQAVFDQAVAAVAAATERLMSDLTVRG